MGRKDSMKRSIADALAANDATSAITSTYDTRSVDTPLSKQRAENVANHQKTRTASGGSVGMQDYNKATAAETAAAALAPKDATSETNPSDNWAADMVAHSTSLPDFKNKLTTMFWGKNNMDEAIKGGGNFVARAEVILPGLNKLNELLEKAVTTETDNAKLSLLMQKQDFFLKGGFKGGWPGYAEFIRKTNANTDKSLEYADVKDYMAGYVAQPWNDPVAEAGSQNKNLIANFRYFAKGLAATYRASVYASTDEQRQRAVRDFNTLLASAYQNVGSSDACHNLLTYLFYEDLDSAPGGVPTDMKPEVRKMLSGRNLQTMAAAARASLYKSGGIQ